VKIWISRPSPLLWLSDELAALVVLPDSLTVQQHAILQQLLEAANIVLDEAFPIFPHSENKRIHQRTLRKDDAVTRRLLSRAGVPSSRLEQPVLTLIEEHMLIGERDIREITNDLGAPPNYTWYYTYTRVDEWEDFVELASMPRDGEADTVTENTILVMNAGAHVRSPVNHRLYSLTPSAISGLDIRSRCFRTVKR
jgi:hypothetical protein